MDPGEPQVYSVWSESVAASEYTHVAGSQDCGGYRRTHPSQAAYGSKAIYVILYLTCNIP